MRCAPPLASRRRRAPRAPRARLAAALAAGLCVLAGCRDRDLPVGEITGARRAAQSDPAAAQGEDRILFGDLHVHTTWSIDAFLYSLPIFGGDGAHPPADACDFARHC